MTDANEPLTRFIEAACVPINDGHRTGTLERAEALLAEHPAIATATIHTAAILGDDRAVRRFLERDAAAARAKGGPHNWDPLTYLCFSRYLRLDPARSQGFVRAAHALLDAGADANTGWHSHDHQPPEWECALYGAAGVAHHPELTRLLLERGADPNDGETVYHTPESYDNAALNVLVEVGKPDANSLASMLLRKHDWHDYTGIGWLLEHGADPNLVTRWGYTALHQAVRRDNAPAIIALLLQHGADPGIVTRRSRFNDRAGQSAIVLAAWGGDRHALELFEKSRSPVALDGVAELLAACARNDAAGVRALVDRHPELVRTLTTHAGEILGEFGGIGNTDGVRLLLDLRLDVAAIVPPGDGYWGIAEHSTPLHVAAWRASHGVVRLLIARGATVDTRDGNGQTPLALAVRACVDSHWTDLRSPASVDALLRAGASVERVPFPSGYAAVDELLQAYGAKPNA